MFCDRAVDFGSLVVIWLFGTVGFGWAVVVSARIVWLGWCVCLLGLLWLCGACVALVWLA